MPLHRHDRRLRPLPPGPSPRLRRRTARSFARSVLVVPPDFDGFLRRASIRRPGPRRSAGLLHPAAGHGVRQVSGLLYGFWPPADLVGPLFEAFPTGVDPSKLFPLQQPSTRHRASPEGVLLAKACAFTERRALSSLERRSPVRVATASSFASPTSGLSSARESVAESGRFRPVRPDAPMGFGSTRSDVCRARGADPPVRASRSTATVPSRRGIRHHPRVAR